MLLANDVAVTSAHTQQELQTMMDHLSEAFNDFRLTIGLKRMMNILEQDT